MIYMKYVAMVKRLIEEGMAEPKAVELVSGGYAIDFKTLHAICQNAHILNSMEVQNV